MGQEWTPKELFFKGTARGETERKSFVSAVGATKVRLSTSSTDGWGFWQIKFNGMTIREHAGGSGGPVSGAALCPNSFLLDDGVGACGTAGEVEIDIATGKESTCFMGSVSL